MPGSLNHRLSRAGLSGVLMAAALAGGAWLHWLEADFLEILPDDVLAMSQSRKIALGDCRLLWAPLEQHWVPLYRLVRLPFDLHFPEWHFGFHALAVAVHLVNAGLLYLLAARYLNSRWGGLAAAVLCAWSRAGEEALIWKISFVYALSWMFVLLSLWCLPRPGRLWAAATGAAAGCSVGLFAGNVLALPGFLITALLAESRAVWRRAAVVCGIAGAAGAAAWLSFAGSRLPAPGGLFVGDWVGRWLSGFAAGGRALCLHVTMGLTPHPERWAAWIAIGLLVLVLGLRRDLPWRPLAGILGMTMGPLIPIMVVRWTPQVWKISRYAYQASFFWYLLAGAGVAAAARRAAEARRERPAVALFAVLAAALFVGEAAAARRSREAWSAHTVTQWIFWSRWDRFFELVAGQGRESGRPLSLPNYRLQLYGLDMHGLYRLCHPFGLPGLTLASGHTVPPEGDAEFWKEAERASRQLPGFHPRDFLAHDVPHGESPRPRF